MTRRTLVASVLAVLALAAPEAQRGRLGQRFQIAGQQYEIVQFRVLSLGSGRTSYLVRVPVRAGEAADSELEQTSVYVTPIGNEWPPAGWGNRCEHPTETISGFPAAVQLSPSVSLGQSYEPDWGANHTLVVMPDLSISVQLDASTCLGWGHYTRTNMEEEDGVRGDHSLALRESPNGPELAAIAADIRRLLSWVTIEGGTVVD